MIEIECKICNEKIEVVGEQSFFRLHLWKIHKIKSKGYYDIYYKKENEGICKCGEQTKFICFNVGYKKYCSKKCSNNDPERSGKISLTKEKKYGNKNYTNREKSEKTCLKIYGVKNVSESDIIKKRKIKTCLKNHGVENYTKTQEFKDRVIKTCLEKYNVDNPSKCEEFKEKRTQTILKRYGVHHYSTSREYRLLKERLKEWIPLEQKTEFEIYARKVWNETIKNKKFLFKNWNNKCYYTNIELNKNQHYNNKTYPSIDHKISVYHGYINNIDYKEIGGIDNLCICSRYMNNKKGILNESEFKEKLCHL